MIDLERLPFVGPCAICLEDPGQDEQGLGHTANKTSHVFHEACIRSWLERNHSCPTCKGAIVSVEKIALRPIVAEIDPIINAEREARILSALLGMRFPNPIYAIQVVETFTTVMNSEVGNRPPMSPNDLQLVRREITVIGFSVDRRRRNNPISPRLSALQCCTIS